jgi:endo-1,4-beta-xylanase
MTVFGVNAEFSASWNEASDFLARAGLKFDQTKTPAQLGTVTGDFAERKTEVPVEGKTSKIYVAVYGWTVDPLSEFYVIEDYGAFVPGPFASDGSPRTHMGTITVDGGTYDIWSLAVKSRPAITGDNKDFNQYFSVRQVRRQCGHVSVSEHFSKWTSLGMTLGKLEEAMFLMEAQNNSGTIDVTTATISVN